MNELENKVQDALHAVREHGTGGLSGPALRRAARRRTFRARTGGVAALSAAGALAVLVAPAPVCCWLTSARCGLRQGYRGSGVTKPVLTGARMVPQAPANVSTVAPSDKITGAPVQANVWPPAGSLIDNQTVLGVAPKAAAHDTDWQSWSGGTLLGQDTVSVVFAGRAPVDSSGPASPRPLVVVTGRTSPGAPLQIAVLTTIAGRADAADLTALAVDAMHPAQGVGSQAIAVSSGLFLYVMAEAGVDRATYAYTDGTGTHAAATKVAGGVACAAVPMADSKATTDGKITNINAVSHGRVVWDAAPVPGR